MSVIENTGSVVHIRAAEADGNWAPFEAGDRVVGAASRLTAAAPAAALASAGLWRHEAEPPVPYARPNSHEFVYLVEGRAVITASDGTSWTLEAGDMLHVPQGFTGTWETQEDVLKFSVAC
ncbi:cupin domain-containing protein [Arthrobacter mobilis]|uniref:DUF861 domain-containing protein n=1 Tax=Arthrobacter mobilis TaxID=2724944 RepID=A0A7X6HBW0_9MICC|nr:cupin domain-containing protein [Arthrobacter mobilis]NKX54244.1 DUF861 domain-containing protein [Arthrobacter mobilis]